MSLKVLHIIPSLNKGGAERITLDICKGLQDEGVTVKLITFRDDNEYPFLTNQLDWMVIQAKVVPSVSGKNTVEVDDLQRETEMFAPDVIHLHLFEALMVFSQIKYENARFIIHFHDNMEQLKKWSWKDGMQKKRLTEIFERKIVLKAFGERDVKSIAIAKDAFSFVKKHLNWNPVLLHNAFNRSRFLCEELENREARVVNIGSFVAKKGQLLAIETVKVLKERGENVLLDLIGDGEMRKQLERFVIEAGVQDRVSFHGKVNHPEEYMKKASLYLHTASYEPFGLVLLEAMASGLPVVCTDGGGNRDLIKEGENGYLVTSRNATELADKIMLLLNNEDKRKVMARKAIDFSKEFDMPEYIKKLLAIYQGR